ncbi:hypothetical protein [Mycolicibacterium mengxianglii]|uniref:hypothetical protein n=1 Tax=Mycolicibacterium mengxianglii TaxID=2736649 RepID=UPI0018D16BF6|nr:hypothetical protein [Mycolicibacterium mengxianglii]
MIAWQEVAIIGGTSIAAIGLIASAFVKNDLRVERRIYWGSWLTLAGFGTAAVWEKGWEARIGIPLICLFVAAFRAYTRTPFLKIGDRIYAWRRSHEEAELPEWEREPPTSSDYPGGVTARKAWWLFAGITVCLGVWAHAESWYGWPGFGVAVCGLMGLITGIDDATRKLPAVRKQHIQGYVILLASIPMFGIPPVAYLIGYQIGLRKPMGTGKQSAGG